MIDPQVDKQRIITAVYAVVKLFPLFNVDDIQAVDEDDADYAGLVIHYTLRWLGHTIQSTDRHNFKNTHKRTDEELQDEIIKSIVYDLMNEYGLYEDR